MPPPDGHPRDPAPTAASDPFPTRDAPDLFPTRDAPRRRLPRTRPTVLLAIAIGGAGGAPTRYAIERVVPPGANGFPWGTFLVDVSGSLLLGILLALILERWPPTRYVRPVAAIGFLGAYTTFSTYMVETNLLWRDGRIGTGAAYVAGTLVAGLGAVYLGFTGVRIWPTARGARR